jgi:hypothetical protein
MGKPCVPRCGLPPDRPSAPRVTKGANAVRRCLSGWRPRAWFSGRELRSFDRLSLIYHGYAIKDFSIMRIAEQNALIKAGLVNRKGKIL